MVRPNIESSEPWFGGVGAKHPTGEKCRLLVRVWGQTAQTVPRLQARGSILPIHGLGSSVQVPFAQVPFVLVPFVLVHEKVLTGREKSLLRLRKILVPLAVWRGCQISHHSVGPCVLDEQEFSSRAVAELLPRFHYQSQTAILSKSLVS